MIGDAIWEYIGFPFILFALAGFEALAYLWPFWSWGVLVWMMIRLGRKIDGKGRL